MNKDEVVTQGNHDDILSGIVSASNVACWCIEFGEPVDLRAPDHEVVRQVFENDPYWRLCNNAMARLYLLPSDREFISQPVSDIFPRNAQNERFVLNLIANGFEVDAAPAHDRRYDGEMIYVENDVRAHIHDGQLLRMFGSVRDVGKHQRREKMLRDQLADMQSVMAALPDPVFVLDDRFSIIAANPATGDLMHLSADEIIGRPFLEQAEIALGSEGARALNKALDHTDAHGVPLLVQTDGPHFRQRWSISPWSAGARSGTVLSVARFTEGGLDHARH